MGILFGNIPRKIKRAEKMMFLEQTMIFLRYICLTILKDRFDYDDTVDNFSLGAENIIIIQTVPTIHI